MKGRIYKRCGCIDPATGRELGNACPKLRRRNGKWSADHGVWYFQAELPRRGDGTRRSPMRRGGFATSTDAQAEIDKISALIVVADARDTTARTVIGDIIDHARRARQPLPSPEEVRRRLDAGTDADEIPTVGQWLDRWLTGRKKLRKGTVRTYASHIRLWLKPQLGHIRLDRLNVDHVARMFDTIAERSDEIEAARASGDPDVGLSVQGKRTTGPATLHRYRATLRAALNAAIRAKLITFNAASYVELPSGKRPKALFHLTAFRGLRRGEACGLPWSETDLTAQTITISSQLVQVGWAAEFGEPKSEASGRVVALDNDTTDVLRAHRRRQAQDRRILGQSWVDSGLVFTDIDGSPLHPAKVSDRFQELAKEAGLPPIRLHDLRHGAATLTLAAGADLKVVQDLLGHSSITITADTYAHVLPELAHETAEAAARMVPRKKRDSNAS